MPAFASDMHKPQFQHHCLSNKKIKSGKHVSGYQTKPAKHAVTQRSTARSRLIQQGMGSRGQLRGKKWAHLGRPHSKGQEAELHTILGQDIIRSA